MMSPTTRKWTRILLAGPGAVIVAIVVMAGMTVWLPRGTAGIDNLVLPLVLVPLIWAALFFHACLDRKLARVAVISLGLLTIHGGLVAHRFLLSHPGEAETRG
jgi:TRAP-type C4-dicarboxylate transport system permease small subunit